MTIQRGGKRENAGRPVAEDTKMVRVPESLVDDVKYMIKEHKKGLKVDPDCVKETKLTAEALAEVSPSALEFFAAFPQRHEELETKMAVLMFFDSFDRCILKLPRLERKLIQKLLYPKNSFLRA